MSKPGRNDPCYCGSGKKFKKCCLDKDKNSQLNSHVNPARQNPVITPDVPHITFRQMIKDLSSQVFDPVSVAYSLVDFCNKDIPPRAFIGNKLNYSVWHLGALILASFASQKPLLNYENTKIKIMTNKAIQEPLLLATGLTSLFDTQKYNSIYEEMSKNDHIILRMMCTQFSLQGDFDTQMARTLFLLGFDANGQIESKFDSLFKAKYGCSTFEYMTLLFAFWSHSLTNPVLWPSKFLKGRKREHYFLKIINNMMKTLSCPMQDIKRQLIEHEKIADAEAIIHSFFASTPFIKVNEDYFINPPHPFLRLSAISGTFFEAISLAIEDDEKNKKSRPETNKYTNWIGKERFEPFVNILLNRFKSKRTTQIWKEHEYIKKKNNLSPDFIISEKIRGRKMVTLVQVKLKRLSRGSFFGHDLRYLDKDIQTGLADLIKKSVSYLYNLELEASKDRLLKENMNISQSVLEADDIFFLGIVPMMPPVFMLRNYRDMLQDALEKSMSSNERNWLVKNRDRLRSWHIIDSEELAFFSGSYNGSGFLKTFMKYLTQEDFGKLVTDHGMSPSFRDWYAYEIKATTRKTPNELQNIFKWFKSQVFEILDCKIKS